MSDLDKICPLCKTNKISDLCSACEYDTNALKEITELEAKVAELHRRKNMEQGAWEQTDAYKEENAKLKTELVKVKEEAKKDYDAMREFQLKFSDSDHERRFLRSKVRTALAALKTITRKLCLNEDEVAELAIKKIGEVT